MAISSNGPRRAGVHLVAEGFGSHERYLPGGILLVGAVPTIKSGPAIAYRENASCQAMGMPQA